MDNTKYLDEDILELIGIDYYREKKWDTYAHNDNGVPRVTHIIEACTDQSGLIDWAAAVGYKKRKSIQEDSLCIGTCVHENIDRYLESRYTTKVPFEIDFSSLGFFTDNRLQANVFNAIESFKAWEANMNNMGAFIEQIIGLEVPLTCPWYGGTTDGIVRINGATYIIDFKTSKKISPDYLVQASAYMWIINNGYAPNLPHIDGIGIIRVDKTKPGVFNDLFLNNFDPKQANYITEFQKCFAAYVNAYYRSLSVSQIFGRYSYIYSPDYVFNKQ